MTEAMCQLPWAWGIAVPLRDPLRIGGHQMPYALYVCLQDEDKIVAFTMDATTGQLTPHATAMGAHAIQTDPSNQFAFVPHIARFNDNVLEPLRESTGPNMIVQLKFDAQTGQLSPNTPLRVEPATRLGPRHYCFHPTLPVVYFSNEQGCSVTAYRLDPATGTLTAVQTLTTLPEGFTARNTCSQIHLTASGQFLYVGNRGHN